MSLRTACIFALLLLSPAALSPAALSPVAVSPVAVSPARLRRGGDDTPGFFAQLWLLLRRFVLPRELQVIYELRSWITELQPPTERVRREELRRVDEIYQHAVYLSEGDAYCAMLACAWATLPYHTFPARVPLLDVSMTVPVSTESRARYERRMANLPGMLFTDTPRGLDRDKLPHFFGSAWLQLFTKTPGVVTLAGELLEWSEAVFKLEGSRDPRDIAINRLGVCFAQALQKQGNVMPSDILINGLEYHEQCSETQNPPR